MAVAKKILSSITIHNGESFPHNCKWVKFISGGGEKRTKMNESTPMNMQITKHDIHHGPYISVKSTNKSPSLTAF